MLIQKPQLNQRNKPTLTWTAYFIKRHSDISVCGVAGVYDMYAAETRQYSKSHLIWTFLLKNNYANISSLCPSSNIFKGQSLGTMTTLSGYPFESQRALCLLDEPQNKKCKTGFNQNHRFVHYVWFRQEKEGIILVWIVHSETFTQG